MSEAERTTMLVGRVKLALAKSRQETPEQRFRKMVDAGLISADGKLRRDPPPSLPKK